jgi:hypothetical protein
VEPAASVELEDGLDAGLVVAQDEVSEVVLASMF